MYLPRSAAEAPAHATEKNPLTKSACSPSGVNESYETYYRTPVPLLVRNLSYVCGGVARNSRNMCRNKVNLALNFLGEFSKSACGCGAVNGGLVEIASNSSMCLKPYEKPMNFACVICSTSWFASW